MKLLTPLTHKNAQLSLDKLCLTLIMLCVVLLSGCSVHKVAGEIAGVEVEASRNDRHHKSDKQSYNRFCPPGQRKKGHCY
ncbi:hypothetical protein DN730_14755 [Marinomonas piezotolerans]|uniref:Lipoprotein n=1 Tax=Marinomonas piezotolerans TaxID=2213058 RepID=A0A370U634_9GAMM|nr:hypothetical protein [Marinomonas piezotolerans]RDL43236.1 hypothetical protein DN730_14755 [Marinomonas piezotolerans]